MALAVVLGASGCCGSIPLSLWLGGSEWASAAARGGRRGPRGVALRAHSVGSPQLRHLPGASPATPPLSRFSHPGHCSLGRSAACRASPCAALVANSPRMLLWGPGRKESPSAPRSEAIWGAFRCFLSAARAGRPAMPARAKRFSVSNACGVGGCVGVLRGLLQARLYNRSWCSGPSLSSCSAHTLHSHIASCSRPSP